MQLYLSIFKWIENTSSSTTIRESVYLFPAIITIHLLTVFLSAGTIVALDLRLLGWGMKRIPVSVIFDQLRPWSLTGFTINIISGALLFWSEPVKMATTGSFILKMVFMALAGVNALFFDRLLYPNVAGWDNALALPGKARFAGGASLFLWAGVIICGRWSAYF
jgi:hypothetical protein